MERLLGSSNFLVRPQVMRSFSTALVSVVLTGCMAGTSTPVSSAPPSIPNPSQTLAASPSLGQSLPITAEVAIGKQTIGLEVAATPVEQQIGLMSRTSLADDRGMLFPFKPAREVNFWMRNTLIPLDIIYLYQGTVREIHQAPPCQADPCPTYPSETSIDQVIELRAGRASELGIKVGDRLLVKSRSSQ
jgi:uncharacterized protein